MTVYYSKSNSVIYFAQVVELNEPKVSRMKTKCQKNFPILLSVLEDTESLYFKHLVDAILTISLICNEKYSPGQ